MQGHLAQESSQWRAHLGVRSHRFAVSLVPWRGLPLPYATSVRPYWTRVLGHSGDWVEDPMRWRIEATQHQTRQIGVLKTKDSLEAVTIGALSGGASEPSGKEAAIARADPTPPVMIQDHHMEDGSAFPEHRGGCTTTLDGRAISWMGSA